MRALSITLLLAACGAASTNPDLGPSPATDLGPTADLLRIAPADLSTPPIGCAAMAQCAIDCGSDLTCEASCYYAGSDRARGLSDRLAACVRQVCVGADGGGRCTSYPGDGSPDCQSCVYNSASGWPGGAACTPATDPACNRCGTQAAACLADF
jgi:hypothetical protein